MTRRADGASHTAPEVAAGAEGAPEELALVCDVRAIPAAERDAHAAAIKRLFASATSRRRLEEGYAFRFPAEELGEVAVFVVRERLCCSFLAFRIEVPPAGGDITLVLTGPEGTGAFLEAELPGGSAG